LNEIELPPNVSAEYHEEARLRLHHYYAHGTALNKWVGDLMQTKPQDHLQKTGDDFRPPQSYIEEWGYELGHNNEIPYGMGAKVQSHSGKVGL
jgi:hypothetical protein